MEYRYINRVELAGMVGTVNEVPVTGEKRFSLLVQETYDTKSGSILIGSTWFTAVADKSLEGYETIETRNPIHIKGKIRMYTCCGPSGERTIYEIAVTEILKED